jgi:DNA-binding NarL/FixJ family response regulator
MILGVVDDLMFSTRLDAAARAAGERFRKIASRSEGHEAAEAERAEGGRVSLVIVDLGWRAGDALALIRELRADPALAATPLIAFGSHVQAERLESARQAGCELALPNSAIAARLPEILRGYLGRR